jgi:putative ABC transport system permease protein
LRKDLGEAPPNAWLAWLPGFVVLLVLLLWSAGDVRLGAWVIVGLTALLLLAGGVVWLASVWLRRAAVRAGGVWRVVVANLRYRPALGVAQVAGLSLGLMALALLAIVRGDLIDSWRASLSPDAPNRFVINIQPDQIPALQAFFSKESLPAPHVFPMVRARLVEVDGKPVVPEKFAEDRARRLAEREWNLSVAVEMQPDNRLLAGRWWTASEQGAPLVSLEQGIAQTLDIRLGNTLTYDINGRRIALRVQSLRKVEWDSMRANFFAVVPPGVLEGYPASYITSFHLPAGQEEVLNRMVRQWPNLTVIDVEAILSQLRAIMDRMTWAVQFVFVFCLLSGLAVLYAALAATRDERAAEVALMRVYGARRHQIRAAALGEFAAIGLAAGLLASLVANVLAAVLASRLLHIAYLPDPWLAVVVVTTGGVLVPAVAWLGLSSVIRTPPRAVLQSV